MITGTNKASVRTEQEKIPSVSNQHLPVSTQIEHYEPRCGRIYCRAALVGCGGVCSAVVAPSAFIMGGGSRRPAPQGRSLTRLINAPRLTGLHLHQHLDLTSSTLILLQLSKREPPPLPPPDLSVEETLNLNHQVSPVIPSCGPEGWGRHRLEPNWS